ncbi:MAG: FkbM family methyltransferase [Brevefilum sp.]|nr:FkbM family methyltransferase [Brevefilum sp.]
MDFSKINYRSFLGRVVRLPLRLIPKNMVMPILQGQLRGKKWVVGAGEHGYWLGSYEMRKRIAFEREIQPQTVVYDIGANVGFYSLLAAHLTGPTGKVYAFEPLHRNVEFIRRHAALNRFETIEIFEAAVSDQAGEAFFDLGVSIATGHLSDSGTVSVHQVRLDDMLAEGVIDPPHIMKVDVEGAEYAVFQGAKTLLETHRPLIFLDTHGRDVHALTIDLLAGYGYQFETLDGRPLPASKELIARP